MDNCENQVNRRPKSRTPPVAYVISLFALLSILCEGYDMGASSGALLLLQESGSITLTPLWQQMVMAGPLPTATLFTLIAARVSDRFGRKKGLMISSFFFTLGAAITVCSNNRQTVLLGRLVLGCGYGENNTLTSSFVDFSLLHG